MTLDRAKQLLKVQADFGGFYNGNSAKLILSEVQREHGQDAVDRAASGNCGWMWFLVSSRAHGLKADW